jgi:hypothetical protein
MVDLMSLDPSLRACRRLARDISIGIRQGFATLGTIGFEGYAAIGMV